MYWVQQENPSFLRFLTTALSSKKDLCTHTHTHTHFDPPIPLSGGAPEPRGEQIITRLYWSLPASLSLSLSLSLIPHFVFHTSSLSSLSSSSLHQTVIYSADLLSPFFLRNGFPLSVPSLPLPSLRFTRGKIKNGGCKGNPPSECPFWPILKQTHDRQAEGVIRTATIQQPQPILPLWSGWYWSPRGTSGGHLGRQRVSSINSNLLAGDWIRCHAWKLSAEALIGAERP